MCIQADLKSNRNKSSFAFISLSTPFFLICRLFSSGLFFLLNNKKYFPLFTNCHWRQNLLENKCRKLDEIKMAENRKKENYETKNERMKRRLWRKKNMMYLRESKNKDWSKKSINRWERMKLKMNLKSYNKDHPNKLKNRI